jgi:hypothetical protein
MFDSEIAIVVRDDLAPWQGLNVTAFLAIVESDYAQFTLAASFDPSFPTWNSSSASTQSV